MPRDILILVIWLAMLENIIGIGYLALHNAVYLCLGNLVVINDPLATDNDLGTKLPED